MIHLDLFSGIGGFAYAVDQVWDDVEHIFCEINPFCQAVLKKHWEGSVIFTDIRELTNMSAFDNIDVCEEKVINTIRLFPYIKKDYLLEKYPYITESLDKQCGKYLNVEDVILGLICDLGKKIISSEELKLKIRLKIYLNELSKKGLLNEKHIANDAEIQGLLKTEELKSKLTIQTIINRLKLFGYARNAITKNTKKGDREVIGGIDILTGGFP